MVKSTPFTFHMCSLSFFFKSSKLVYSTPALNTSGFCYVADVSEEQKSKRAPYFVSRLACWIGVEDIRVYYSRRVELMTHQDLHIYSKFRIYISVAHVSIAFGYFTVLFLRTLDPI